MDLQELIAANLFLVDSRLRGNDGGDNGRRFQSFPAD